MTSLLDRSAVVVPVQHLLQLTRRWRREANHLDRELGAIQRELEGWQRHVHDQRLAGAPADPALRRCLLLQAMVDQRAEELAERQLALAGVREEIGRQRWPLGCAAATGVAAPA
ncbi:MAG TPA: hypothetical protein VK348_05905 [Planctomycetota bacterium]|nr:hypothetical protein [Planctomycetota bacterium]